MKFPVNILLIIVILAAIVIPPRACQEETSANKTTYETSTDETSTQTVRLYYPQSIIVVPPRNIFTACLDGQKKDSTGRCRNIV
ncbi:hypothetical protein P5V15_006334 [Pogonomyrmex californicus]